MFHPSLLKIFTMKKLLLVMMGSALLATSAFAQDAPAQPAANPEPAAKPTEVKKTDMKQDRVEWEKKIKTELSLTAEQAAKFDALNKEYNDKIDAVLADASLAADAQKEKKTALKKEKEAKLMEIFSAEQQAKYKGMTEKKKKEALKPA
jgi:Spy/CpxP family protein refolding chaperone